MGIGGSYIERDIIFCFSQVLCFKARAVSVWRARPIPKGVSSMDRSANFDDGDIGNGGKNWACIAVADIHTF
jgi:hypothetical protein